MIPVLSVGGDHVLKIQQKQSQVRTAPDGCSRADSVATGVQTARGPGRETGSPGQGLQEPKAVPSENQATVHPLPPPRVRSLCNE